MHTVTLCPQNTSHRPPPPPPPVRRRGALRVGIDVTILAAILDGPGRGPANRSRVRSPIAFADTIRPEAVITRRVGDGENVNDRQLNLCERLLARKIVPEGPPPALPKIPAPPAEERPWTAAPPPPPRPDHEPAIIGQEEALRRLDAAMERARSGAGVAILLRGGGDATTATLARRAIGRLAAPGREPVRLVGAGLERSGVPFQMIAAIVGAIVEHLSRLSASDRAVALAGGVACLARLFPCVDALAPATPGVALPVLSAGCQRRAMTELRAILGAIATLRPIALLVEDLHLGDPDSAALLDVLLAGGLPRGVTVLATLRAGAEEMAALPRAIASFETIQVASLPHEEAILYTRRRLRAHESASLGLARPIAAAGGKRPVLMELLAQLLARRPAAEVAALQSSPPTIDRILEAVLSDMPSIDRAVLELVALDGAPIFHELLDRAAEQRACYSLDRLEEAGLCAYSDDRATVRIPHAQVAEAIVRLIPEDRRTSHRRALADAHRRCARGDLARAAYHCLGADAWKEAGELASEAARQAKQASAYGLAADLCELALCTDPRSRSLRLRLADVQAAAGRYEAAANNRLRVALAARDGRRLELAAEACELLFLAGRRDRGRRTAAMILGEIGSELQGDRERRRTILLAELAALGGHPLEFREQSRCELGSDLLRRLDVSLRMARLLLLEDPLAAGILAARGAQLALLAGEPRLVAMALALAGRSAAEHDPALADRLLDRAGEIARSIADPRGAALVELCRGLALVGEDPTRARHHLDACITATGELGEESRWEHTIALTARERALAA